MQKIIETIGIGFMYLICLSIIYLILFAPIVENWDEIKHYKGSQLIWIVLWLLVVCWVLGFMFGNI